MPNHNTLRSPTAARPGPATLCWEPPSQEFRDLLQQAATRPAALTLAPLRAPPPRRAGWLVSKHVSGPSLIVAQTVRDAVLLLRQMYSAGLIEEDSWQELLATDKSACLPSATQSPPPSGQKRARDPDSPDARLPKRLMQGLPSDDDDLDGTPAATFTAINSPNAPASPTPTPATSDVLITTVTNHNRQAERRRAQKQDEANTRRREAAGLVAPAPNAPPTEHVAHRSIARKDEADVSWIFKQALGDEDFFHVARSPYTTANTMLQHARAIGDASACTHASYFVQNWRQSGHPLIVSNGLPSALSQSSTAATATHSSLGSLWDAVTFCEAVTATAGVGVRWGLAMIAQRYEEKKEQIDAADRAQGNVQGARRGGQGRVATRAKRALWGEDNLESRVSWGAFVQRLKRARRWHEAAKTLGWGFLMLVPAATVSRYWSEQTLQAAEWTLWLQLVKRVNPEAVRVSCAFDEWLGPSALQGGPLPDTERLALEADLVARVREVPDSDNEDGDEELEDSDEELEAGDEQDSDNNRMEMQRRRVRLEKSAGEETTTPALRQLTLHDLFKPCRT